MTTQELIDRARSVVGQPCKYKLGEGGRLWHAETPWNPHTLGCDCSGFVAWSLGMDRHTPDTFYKKWNGGWIETSAVVRDALEHDGVGFFDRIEVAEPGAVLVYPDRKVKGKVRQGHIGIVIEPPTPTFGLFNVVHCSAGNFRRLGNAIAETDDALWRKNPGTVIARCTLIER